MRTAFIAQQRPITLCAVLHLFADPIPPPLFVDTDYFLQPELSGPKQAPIERLLVRIWKCG